MVQEHNQDGQSPLHDPQHGGPVNPVPANQFGQTPAFGGPPQGTNDESWLMRDDGAFEDIRIDPSDSPSDEPSLVISEDRRDEPDQSWLLSDDTDDDGAPTVAPVPVAGDAPAILEASFVSEDSGRSLRALMVPVGFGAVMVLGGLVAFRFLVQRDSGTTAPEAVSVTEDLHRDTVLVAPKSSPAVIMSQDSGRQAIDRKGQVQVAQPKDAAPVQVSSATPAAGETLALGAPTHSIALTEIPADVVPESNELAPQSASTNPAILLPFGPFGSPPPLAWEDFISKEAVATAVAKPDRLSPSVDSAPEGALASESDFIDREQADADLLAWLNSDEDLPFYSLGGMDSAPLQQPGVVSDGAPATQQESGPLLDEESGETSASVLVDPDPAVVAVAPEPTYLAGLPLVLEPIWPGIQFDPLGMDELDLIASEPEFELWGQDEQVQLWPADVEEEHSDLEHGIEPLAPIELLDFGTFPAQEMGPVAQADEPIGQPTADPSIDFGLGRDPVEWAHDLGLQKEQEHLEGQLTELEALAQAALASEELASAEAAPMAEALAMAEEAPMAEKLASAETAPMAEKLASGEAAPLTETDPLADFKSLLATAEEQDADQQPSVEIMPEPEQATDLAVVRLPGDGVEAPSLQDPVHADQEGLDEQAIADPGVDLALAEAIPVNPAQQPGVSIEPPVDTEVAVESIVSSMVPSNDAMMTEEPAPRSLLETYSDWMRIQDQAPVTSLAYGGLTGVQGHESLPYGLAQHASENAASSNIENHSVEVGESQAPRRGGVLRRASGDHRWEDIEVPRRAVGVERKLLTPNVGPVRVVLVDGESLEGRLHAVGFGRIWIESKLGRMSLEDRRVQDIFKLDPGHIPTVPGARRDYSGYPRVRVKAKGGIFVGHQMSREGNRITLVTDKGSRVTLEDVEIMPARQFRPIGLRRATQASSGSPASPK